MSDSYNVNALALAARAARGLDSDDMGITANHERVMRYRNVAKDMGLKQVNVYVPEDRKVWIQAQAEYYRAVDMFDRVIPLDIYDPARVALANRNYQSMPSKANLDYLDSMIRAYKLTGLSERYKTILDYMEKHRAHRYALAVVKSEEEAYHLSAIAVASSMMAASLYKLLSLEVGDAISRLPQEGKE